MTRSALTGLLALVLTGPAVAQCYSGIPVTSTVSNVSGFLTMLNAPLVPGLPTVPGMPTPSVLGLLSPRLSLAAGFIQDGGFSGPNVGQYVVGLAAPRLAPVFALQAGTLQPQQAVLGILAPRAAVGVQLVQGLGVGGAFGDRRLFGRSGCR